MYLCVLQEGKIERISILDSFQQMLQPPSYEFGWGVLSCMDRSGQKQGRLLDVVGAVDGRTGSGLSSDGQDLNVVSLFLVLCLPPRVSNVVELHLEGEFDGRRNKVVLDPSQRGLEVEVTVTSDDRSVFAIAVALGVLEVSLALPLALPMFLFLFLLCDLEFNKGIGPRGFVVHALLKGRDLVNAQRSTVLSIGHGQQVFPRFTGQIVHHQGSSLNDMKQEQVCRHGRCRGISRRCGIVQQRLQIVVSQGQKGIIGGSKDGPGLFGGCQIFVQTRHFQRFAQNAVQFRLANRFGDRRRAIHVVVVGLGRGTTNQHTLQQELYCKCKRRRFLCQRGLKKWHDGYSTVVCLGLVY
mmetsp:Transcript_19995/g.36099  ORF Transcript_19995/g.36099 Transcript_19995/m.36099 type:complete len:353 (-) Transcript_19995:332-1390(-)